MEELTIFRHKLSRFIPKCRDSTFKLVHANYETVNFVVLSHKGEWVTANDLLARLFEGGGVYRLENWENPTH